MLLRLTINGRRKSFGYYADEIEAAKAYLSRQIQATAALFLATILQPANPR
ncbi:hypothetical protein ES703_81520 [subsurface metagenome]